MEFRRDLLRAREDAGNRYVAAATRRALPSALMSRKRLTAGRCQVDPGSGQARTGLEAVRMDRRHAEIVAQAQTLLKNGDAEGASARLKAVFLENPSNGSALQLQRQISERTAKELALVPSLKANFQKPVTLQFRDANLRMVLESISKTSASISCWTRMCGPT